MLPKSLVAASLRPLLLSLLANRALYGCELIQRVHELSGGKITWTAIATWRHYFAERRGFLKEDLDELERHVRDH